MAAVVSILLVVLGSAEGQGSFCFHILQLSYKRLNQIYGLRE